MSSGRLPLVFWEVRKILRKKESYLFLIMVLILVLYGIGFASGSDSFIYRGTEPMSCLRWVQTIFVMVQQFLIFHIALVIVVVRALSSEIEEGPRARRLPPPGLRRGDPPDDGCPEGPGRRS